MVSPQSLDLPGMNRDSSGAPRLPKETGDRDTCRAGTDIYLKVHRDLILSGLPAPNGPRLIYPSALSLCKPRRDSKGSATVTLMHSHTNGKRTKVGDSVQRCALLIRLPLSFPRFPSRFTMCHAEQCVHRLVMEAPTHSSRTRNTDRSLPVKLEIFKPEATFSRMASKLTCFPTGEQSLLHRRRQNFLGARDVEYSSV